MTQSIPRPSRPGSLHFGSAGPILGLLFPGSPAAIVRGVIAAVIKAFQGVGRRGPKPKILYEIQERVPPAVAYGDASAPIPFVMRCVGVKAPLLHAHPGTIFMADQRTVVPLVMSGPMFLSWPGTTRASARRSVASLKRLANDLDFSPAIARAKPHCFVVAVGEDAPDSGEMALFESSQVINAPIPRHRAPPPSCADTIIHGCYCG